MSLTFGPAEAEPTQFSELSVTVCVRLNRLSRCTENIGRVVGVSNRVRRVGPKKAAPEADQQQLSRSGNTDAPRDFRPFFAAESLQTAQETGEVLKFGLAEAGSAGMLELLKKAFQRRCPAVMKERAVMTHSA